MSQLQVLQQRMRHTFSQTGLLERALTHRSFSSNHYERLEFLGDSVLNLCISDLLYTRLGALPEGDLSRIRANLVKQDTLHQLAEKLQLSAYIHLGEGELRSGGKSRPSILADVVEALVGAVYLDAGFAKAQALVLCLYEDIDINPQMQAISKDAKTALQEWLQRRKMKVPVYKVISTQGAAHQQSFDVECEIPEWSMKERGTGVSRRAAEQSAAAVMLQKVKAKV